MQTEKTVISKLFQEKTNLTEKKEKIQGQKTIINKRNNKMKKRQKSFTLIELLVVIAIIAILAAILLPALNSARERGRSASCVSSLKQYGNAMMAYHDAYDDYFVPAKGGGAGGEQLDYYLAPFVYGMSLEQKLSGLKPGQVPTCPSTASTFSVANQNRMTYSYHQSYDGDSFKAGYGVYYGAATPAYTQKVTKLQSVSGMMVLLDLPGALANKYISWKLREGGTRTASTGLGEGLLFGKGSHGNRDNMLMADAHVEDIVFSDIPETGGFWTHLAND
jgi:prepilin-type N-terminal cleavage/methylation domain-containing protein/prepilin-type processing-associated H-X9-DG protein